MITQVRRVHRFRISIHPSHLDRLVRLGRGGIAHGRLQIIMPQQVGQGADVAWILLQE
jgi:hypothetical protein